MTATVPGILARIVAHKQSELAALIARRAGLERDAQLAPRRDFRAALIGKVPAIIAEAKKASPSKGLLSGDYDPARIAAAYESAGASAVSVLTDERFFQGSLADLRAARAAIGIPVLRKDFTIDEIHVVEAGANGADAILLIAAILTTPQMLRFRELAAQFGMAALVEVHNEEELERAIDSGAEILGVNNRDLHTFQVSLHTSLKLAGRIPSRAIKVSESGIHSASDIRILRDAGYQAFLVGEHLMKSGDPVQALSALLLR
ncbi:MAG: indole-3-glycerol phosphate synthase TrpC [Bryobacteraceae bacterium]|nr:indole-3-glycerol phosphate synthase TrpC [Bryobacteraceae bacterium]